MAGRVLRSSNGRFAGSTKGWMKGVKRGAGNLRGDARRRKYLAGPQMWPEDFHRTGMGRGSVKRANGYRTNVTLGQRMSNSDKRYNIRRSITRMETKLTKGNLSSFERAKVVSGIKVRREAISKIRG